MLFSEIKKRFAITYLITSRINNEAIENLFAQLRTSGGVNDYPTPLHALQRLRMIFLGKNMFNN